MAFKWASIEDIKRLTEHIKNKFAELGTAAFLNLAENLAVTEKGKFVPDAILVADQQRTIEALQAKVNELNSTLESIDSEKILALLPFFLSESINQKITTTASAWKTIQFTGFNMPDGYRLFSTSFNANNAGAVIVLSNESNNTTYIRIYCEYSIEVSVSVNRTYANKRLFSS